MGKRYNIEDGCYEVKIVPEGLPPIWIKEEGGLCKHCEPYGECLSLERQDDQEFEEKMKSLETNGESDHFVCVFTVDD